MAVQLSCRCRRTWIYGGSATRATCPSCHGKVRVRPLKKKKTRVPVSHYHKLYDSGETAKEVDVSKFNDSGEPANLRQSLEEWWRLSRQESSRRTFDPDEVIVSSDIGDIQLGTESLVETNRGRAFMGKRARYRLRGILFRPVYSPPPAEPSPAEPQQYNPFAAAAAFTGWQLSQHERKKKQQGSPDKDFWDKLMEMYAMKQVLKKRRNY